MDIYKLLEAAKLSKSTSCYKQRINSLGKKGFDTSIITKGVGETVRVLDEGHKSFVIYGEPQSGKTEFMIALTCRLLDLGYQTIFVLINDNVELEVQNFRRFHATLEFPITPVRDSQIVNQDDNDLKLIKQRIIFCRKNSKNLKKLIHACRFMKKRIVLDDEADYATPNTKINKENITAINKRVGKLGDLRRLNGEDEIEGAGTYIGITATPARLDLNNTFYNDSKKWIFLDSSEAYKGRAFFFPATPAELSQSNYLLKKLPEKGDEPIHLRSAVLRFIVRVSIMNLMDGYAENVIPFSMLVHTAGKVDDHEEDEKIIQKIFTALGDENHSSYIRYWKELASIIKKLVHDHQSSSTVEEIFTFIHSNQGRREILVINHRNDSENVQKACNPNSLFTFAIGGNIVSRGLTFNSLLTFFFSRNVKGKLQQNTYIQRARMFGYRDYAKYFELCVPGKLFSDWANCFNNHELSLRLAKAGVYQHVQKGRMSVIDAAARDNKNVTVEKSERTVGGIFELTEEIEQRLIKLNKEKPLSGLINLVDENVLSYEHLPKAVLTYLREVCSANESDLFIVFTKDGIQSIDSYADGNETTITRPRGGIIHAMLNRRTEYETYRHFILPIKNNKGQARFLYKSNIGHSILQNLRSN